MRILKGVPADFFKANPSIIQPLKQYQNECLL